MSTLRQRFTRSRAAAEHRGIVWRLTFEEFVDLWAPHWHNQESMELCRTGDLGPYEVGNVRVDTREANLQDMRPRAVVGRIVPLPERVARLERMAVGLSLLKANGNMTEAAHRIGITFRQYRYLYHKYFK